MPANTDRLLIPLGELRSFGMLSRIMTDEPSPSSGANKVGQGCKSRPVRDLARSFSPKSCRARASNLTSPRTDLFAGFCLIWVQEAASGNLRSERRLDLRDTLGIAVKSNAMTSSYFLRVS